MSFFRRPSTWLILAGLVAPLSPAFAQSNGQFTLTEGFTYSYEHVQHGNTKFTAGSLEGGAIVSSSKGGDLFPEGQSFLASCVVFSEESAGGGGIDLKAPCTFMETEEGSEDELFVLLTRKQGDLGGAESGGMGRGDLVGGTGKYANVTGNCSYEVQYLNESNAVIMWDCNWSKP